MKRFIVEATRSTPFIYFDPENHVLEIRGESYPENSAAFYEPLFTLLREYLRVGGTQRFEVNLEILYFNSSGSKILMNLFEMLEIAAKNGKNIVANWYYHEENDISLEFGEEFMEDLSAVVFNLVKIPAQ